MRQVDLRQILALAETIASELATTALDRWADLTPADRHGLVTIAAAVDAMAAVWAGLPARSLEAQRILDEALAAVLPEVGHDRDRSTGCVTAP